MNGTKTIYLAGKVNGPKNKVASSFLWFEDHMASTTKPPFRTKYRFVSSDTVDHDHMDLAPSLFAELLDECDILVAFVDTPDCFGTIAEVAYSAAKGKPCYLVIDQSKLDIENGFSMRNAYWFVAGLSGVTPFWFTQPHIASAFVGCLVKAESPIEVLLLGQLFGMHSNPNAYIELVSQFWAEGYRLDFAYPNLKVGVEVDGHDFHKTKEQRTKDAHRDRVLTKAGWTILRFTGSEIFSNPYKAAKEIADILPAWEELETEEAA